MLLSQTGKYALRAAIYLAERDEAEAGAVSVGEIARDLNVPQNYLSKILHLLARDGLLVSERGPRGGFRLAPEASQLSLARILRPVDPQEENRCLLGRPECSDTDPCPLHGRWRELAGGIDDLLQDTSLAELVRQEKRGRTT